MAIENNVVAEEQVTDAVQEKPVAAKRKARSPKKVASAKVEAAPIVEAEAPKNKKRSPAERTRLLALIAKQTKGGKITLKAALKDAGVSEQTYYNWKNQAAKTLAAPAAQTDDLKDLVELEVENKRLRKELAQKLRAENAELRKRLGLS